MKRRSFVSLTGTGAGLLRGEATRAGGVGQSRKVERVPESL